MTTTNLSIKLAGLLLAGTLLDPSPQDSRLQDPRLHVAMKLDLPSAGVSVAPDCRKFLVIVRLDGSAGPRVLAGRQDGGQANGTRGDAATIGFVRVNAQRIGPDGKLWLVDVGAPGIGDEVLPGGANRPRVQRGRSGLSARRRSRRVMSTTSASTGATPISPMPACPASSSSRPGAFSTATRRRLERNRSRAKADG